MSIDRLQHVDVIDRRRGLLRRDVTMKSLGAGAAILLVIALGACSADSSHVEDRRLDSSASSAEAGLHDAGRGAVDSTPVTDAPGSQLDGTPRPDQSGPALDGQPGEFTLSHGGRDYRLLVPSGYRASAPIPLLVGFHGAGDSGANFFAICKAVGFAAAAAPANFILLVPETKSPYQDFAVWTGDPSNDVPQMKAEMNEIAAVIEDVSLHYRVDAKQVHAFGFSDGGLFAAVGGMHRADFFASLAICGYGWGASYPMVAPGRKIATQFICGQDDSFFSLAQASASFLDSAGHPTQLLTAPGVGHLFSGLMQAHPPVTIAAWMQQHPLP